MFADGTYGGNKLAGALKQAHCPITVEVVKKAKDTARDLKISKVDSIP